MTSYPESRRVLSSDVACRGGVDMNVHRPRSRSHTGYRGSGRCTSRSPQANPSSSPSVTCTNDSASSRPRSTPPPQAHWRRARSGRFPKLPSAPSELPSQSRSAACRVRVGGRRGEARGAGELWRRGRGSSLWPTARRIGSCLPGTFPAVSRLVFAVELHPNCDWLE